MSATASIPFLRKQGTATQLVVQGRPLSLLAGELHNSSASSLAYVEPVLDRMAALHCNAVLAPLYWELLEPSEGVYDFTLLDGLVEAARARRIHVVFLWFGTIKNAMASYTPAWVKTNPGRFPRVELRPGAGCAAVSVFTPDAMACDARAFAAAMRRIRQIDGAGETVVMMQVENEAGILGAPRDFCPAAREAFAAPVPPELLRHLAAQRASLIPEFDAVWRATDYRMSGNWSEVFGQGADEVFMAWHTARFIEGVTAAGRAEYDLPMYANAWLVQGAWDQPGQYPSGGPVSRMLDVWRVAAPHIDLLAPDIYMEDFRGQCASYHRSGNPLFIPEARRDPVAAATALYAIGRHDAMGFAPFGIDSVDPQHPLTDTYRVLGQMMPMLAAAQGSGRMTAFLQQADSEEWQAEVGGFRFRARTGRKLSECRVPGSALLLAVGQDEFIAVGRNLILNFRPRDPAVATAEIVWLDVGAFVAGEWPSGRRLNGDETHHGSAVLLGEDLTACRFKLHAYR